MIKFKNDKERIQFLEAYQDEGNPYAANWSLWKEDAILGRRWWITHIKTVIFLVEEELVTCTWPEKHKRWATRHFFIYDGPVLGNSYNQETTMGDRKASRTMCLQKIKEMEKEERG